MTELRTPTRSFPDLDAEEEVDLSRLWRTVTARWWLPVLATVLGILVGYAVSLGGGKVYEATAVVSLGIPLGVGGNTPVPSLATDPTIVGEIVHSESALKQAAARSGLRLNRLRGRVSSEAVTVPRGSGRASQARLVEVSVTGAGPRKVESAANTLAARVVAQISDYPDLKIATLSQDLESQTTALASVERTIRVLRAAVRRAQALTPIEQLPLVTQLNDAEQRRTQLTEDRSETRQELAVARVIERAQVIEQAAARETTARSTRNSMVVGGIIGLLLGVVAALAWDPLARRPRRERPA
ncbi:MAG: Wzz/FepE/Etk N-terminal domain-containing protein [Actinomycetota bacterium]|nr:Wzz/FepE/Etk N-terminal domain-containing protein [Actinomycetota bacterium]